MNCVYICLFAIEALYKTFLILLLKDGNFSNLALRSGRRSSKLGSEIKK